MAEQKPPLNLGNIAVPVIISAVIGVGVVGFNQSAKNDADNISNLPALVD